MDGTVPLVLDVSFAKNGQLRGMRENSVQEEGFSAGCGGGV